MEETKSPELIRLGKNIRELRTREGVSQEDLALQAGLDRTYLGGAERGERNLTVLSLLKICRPLKVSLSELLKGVGNDF